MKRLIGMDLIRAYDEHPENFLPMNKPGNEVPPLGIEDETPEELEQRFLDRGYYRKKEGADRAPTVRKFDRDGKEFYSINVTVGMEDEPAVLEGAYILSWNMYNKYIRSLKHDE